MLVGYGYLYGELRYILLMWQKLQLGPVSFAIKGYLG